MSVYGILPQHIRNLIMSKDIEQISAVLQAYQEAINNASAEDCARLYTQDGIAMPQHSPTCVGMAKVHKIYEDIFEITEFDIKIDVQEIVPVSPEYAFARANSAGSKIVKGQGNGVDASQMLFVFRKVGGEWKITRYCFSTSNPPPG